MCVCSDPLRLITLDSHTHFCSEHGVPVNALYTYIKMLLNFILESEYDYIGMNITTTITTLQ